MCGIAGIFRSDGAEVEATHLEALGNALAHRGPDGVGYHREGPIGLVHRRLAIIDLEGGAQPIHSPRGEVIVGNGEIYNYIELRRELGDYPYSTDGDIETALHAFLKHGRGYTDRLRGMYALAVYEPSSGRLSLSRDPFGIKPLYYIEAEGFFAFASEPGALLKAGLVPACERALSRAQLLQLQFTCGKETIFDGIKRVLPGETLTIENGRIVESIQKRISQFIGKKSLPDDEASLIQSFDEVFRSSVDVHQRSDVPYGLFLSGGIDSTSVLSMMAELNSSPVRTFTAGFESRTVHDERETARSISEKFGADHTEVAFTADDFWQLLPRIAASMDDPVADYAILPTWKLASVAKKDVKVVLSGEGGDELFAGYGRYRKAIRPWLLGGKAMRASGMMDDFFLLDDDFTGWREEISLEEKRVASETSDRLLRAQLTDCADWLPNDLLLKLDRCLMAHGVEGRTPFLDPEMASFAFSLHARYKVSGKIGKYIVRKWLQKRIPDLDFFTRKKGFTVPVGDWMKVRADDLDRSLVSSAALHRRLERGRVKSILEKGGNGTLAVWTLLFYALWYGSNILGHDVSDSDVIAALNMQA